MELNSLGLPNWVDENEEIIDSLSKEIEDDIVFYSTRSKKRIFDKYNWKFIVNCYEKLAHVSILAQIKYLQTANQIQDVDWFCSNILFLSKRHKMGLTTYRAI